MEMSNSTIIIRNEKFNLHRRNRIKNFFVYLTISSERVASSSEYTTAHLICVSDGGKGPDIGELSY